MKIRSVDAAWVHCPLDAAKQHVSDFGRIAAFDAVLVTITTEEGLVGYGEAKPAVGSAGNGAALVTIVEQELRPLLVGQDPRHIGRAWSRMYNGTRAGLAERSGRAMPVLGRRGIHIAAMSGVDLALWDVTAKSRGCSVLDLLGGPCRDRVLAYASGGWADAARSARNSAATRSRASAPSRCASARWTAASTRASRARPRRGRRSAPTWR